MERVDVVIIGAGPAGLTAGIYCGRAKVRTVVFEALSAGGQALMAGTIENYPGFPGGISGTELIDRFKRQLLELGVPLEEFVKVEAVEPKDDLFLIRTSKGQAESRALIIATGAQPARLGVPGEDRFVGQGVSFCATCDGFFFKDRRVAVVGGGDRAVEEALFLKNMAREVFLIHRRDRLRAQRILQERLFKSPNVKPLWNHVVSEIKGDETGVKALELLNTQSGSRTTLEVEGVFIAIGQQPSSEIFRGLVEMDPQGFIKTDARGNTSRPGIFAAGDVRAKELRQVSTAVGDGAIAAWSATQYLESS
ncbi:MAG: thioredoxin-disulfide reductase [Deltaproteobacteria bacterium]|nr:MAG: thioredoxin-disulfide reductase [Deltaproteobacteria bacterium]